MALLSCDTVPLILPRVLPHGLYPGLGMVVVKNGMLLLVMCPMIVVTLLKKGPADQEDTSRCIFSCHSGSRASGAEEVEKIAPPFLRGGGG